MKPIWRRIELAGKSSENLIDWCPGPLRGRFVGDGIDEHHAAPVTAKIAEVVADRVGVTLAGDDLGEGSVIGADVGAAIQVTLSRDDESRLRVDAQSGRTQSAAFTCSDRDPAGWFVRESRAAHSL